MCPRSPLQPSSHSSFSASLSSSRIRAVDVAALALVPVVVLVVLVAYHVLRPRQQTHGDDIPRLRPRLSFTAPAVLAVVLVVVVLLSLIKRMSNLAIIQGRRVHRGYPNS